MVGQWAAEQKITQITLKTGLCQENIGLILQDKKPAAASDKMQPVRLTDPVG